MALSGSIICSSVLLEWAEVEELSGGAYDTSSLPAFVQ
jgi:hypothetical protein